MRNRFGRLVLGILFLSPFLIGDEPLPPPYHQYYVFGQIARQSVGPKQNFVVTLVGQFSESYFDTTVELVPPNIIPDNADILWSVTDTSGKFVLDVKTEAKADSIAIKVAAADKPPYVSVFIFVPEPTSTFMGEYPNPSSKACNGCSTTEPLQQYVKGYRYQLPEQLVIVPF